jgi:hypothetical protein
MNRVVLAKEIQPGDVYLSHVDGKPHWVDDVEVAYFEQPACALKFGKTVIECGAVSDEIRVLLVEGERRIEVHHLELPVLVNRPFPGNPRSAQRARAADNHPANRTGEARTAYLRSLPRETDAHRPGVEEPSARGQRKREYGMNLSTPVDEGYRELIERAEEDVRRRVDTLHKKGESVWNHLTGPETERLARLESWLDDLEIIRKREWAEQAQARRCA